MASGRIVVLAAGVAFAAATAGALPAQAQASQWTAPPQPTTHHAPDLSAPPAVAGPSHALTPHNGPGVPNTAGLAGGSTFTPVTPQRVLDTRDGTGRGGQPVGPVPADSSITLDLKSVLPAGATAVVFNLTATNVTANTNVTAYPTGSGPRPTTSNLNLLPGQTRPNLVTVALNSNEAVDFYNHVGSVDLIADLAGYYAVGTGGGYTSQSPSRVLDTRDGTGQNGTVAPVGSNASITLDLSGVLPSNATSVVFNLTGTNVTGNTNVTAWPDGAARPSASNLNLTPGQTAPNLVTVAVGANRKVDFYNHTGSVDLIADLAGYYATGSGNPFYSLTPVRAFDSRDGEPLGPNQAGSVPFTPWIPAAASALVYNLTGTDATAATNVTAWPTGQNLPSSSNLNLAAGETAPNLAITALGANGQISFYNHAGTVNLIMDIAGYFSPAPPACTTGCVYATGDNYYAEQANGTIGGFDTGSYLQIPNLPRVTAVTGGRENGYALRADGTVWAWGQNEFAGLGNGVGFGFSVVPTPVSALDGGVTSVVATEYGAYALKSNGTVWAWGDNYYGEYGNGASGDGATKASPVQVPGLTGVTALASAGGTGYALKSDGTVWSWGYNGNGETGTGSTAEIVTSPTQVSGLSGVVSVGGAITGGYAVKSDGTVWSWGSNVYGGLGTTAVPVGGNNFTATPVQVQGLSGIKFVGNGLSDTGYAVNAGGNLFAWGSNTGGEYGNGTYTGGATVVQVPGITSVTALAPGGGMSAIAGGKAYAWGNAKFGATPAALPGAATASAVGAGVFAQYAIVITP
ncbi:hypothetical protein [Kutzneria sp. NPDC052558]|uniref:hypothetical protein n=1 Tax=Kutzneria sp. NPDC052558 TaxID=3364121 RepID=UPI0037CA607B